MTLRWLVRAQGFAFDAILIGVAAAVAAAAVQRWLFANPRALFHGLAVLHIVTCPALLVAIVAGYGKAGGREEAQRRGPGVLGWATAFLWGGSFVIPGVLGLIFGIPGWEMAVAIFAPLGVVVLWLWALVVAEKRKWIRPALVGEAKPWWRVQSLALLSWAYLIWLESMLIAAASHRGPLSTVGIPLGVMIDYLPIRVALYYIRDNVSRWELCTILLGMVHLLYRIAAA